MILTNIDLTLYPFKPQFTPHISLSERRNNESKPNHTQAENRLAIPPVESKSPSPTLCSSSFTRCMGNIMDRYKVIQYVLNESAPVLMHQNNGRKEIHAAKAVNTKDICLFAKTPVGCV